MPGEHCLGRLAGWLLAALTTGLVTACVPSHAHQGPVAGRVTHRGRDASLAVAATTAQWYGHPVYVLTNPSSGSELRQLTIVNWANELLPILYIGRNPPDELEAARRRLSPPYVVPPGECIYFAGSLAQPERITVYWADAAGNEHNESFRLPFDTPPE